MKRVLSIEDITFPESPSDNASVVKRSKIDKSSAAANTHSDDELSELFERSSPGSKEALHTELMETPWSPSEPQMTDPSCSDCGGFVYGSSISTMIRGDIHVHVLTKTVGGRVTRGEILKLNPVGSMILHHMECDNEGCKEFDDLAHRSKSDMAKQLERGGPLASLDGEMCKACGFLFGPNEIFLTSQDLNYLHSKFFLEEMDDPGFYELGTIMSSYVHNYRCILPMMRQFSVEYIRDMRLAESMMSLDDGGMYRLVSYVSKKCRKCLYEFDTKTPDEGNCRIGYASIRHLAVCTKHNASGEDVSTATSVDTDSTCCRCGFAYGGKIHVKLTQTEAYTVLYNLGERYPTDRVTVLSPAASLYVHHNRCTKRLDMLPLTNGIMVDTPVAGTADIDQDMECKKCDRFLTVSSEKIFLTDDVRTKMEKLLRRKVNDGVLTGVEMILYHNFTCC